VIETPAAFTAEEAKKFNQKIAQNISLEFDLVSEIQNVKVMKIVG
jgi:hypothetical protein